MQQITKELTRSRGTATAVCRHHIIILLMMMLVGHTTTTTGHHNGAWWLVQVLQLDRAEDAASKVRGSREGKVRGSREVYVLLFCVHFIGG